MRLDELITGLGGTQAASLEVPIVLRIEGQNGQLVAEAPLTEAFAEIKGGRLLLVGRVRKPPTPRKSRTSRLGSTLEGKTTTD